MRLDVDDLDGWQWLFLIVLVVLLRQDQVQDRRNKSRHQD